MRQLLLFSCYYHELSRLNTLTCCMKYSFLESIFETSLKYAIFSVLKNARESNYFSFAVMLEFYLLNTSSRSLFAWFSFLKEGLRYLIYHFRLKTASCNINAFLERGSCNIWFENILDNLLIWMHGILDHGMQIVGRHFRIHRIFFTIRWRLSVSRQICFGLTSIKVQWFAKLTSTYQRFLNAF